MRRESTVKIICILAHVGAETRDSPKSFHIANHVWMKDGRMNNEFSEREARVRESFSRQGFMRHLGSEVTALAPGECEIRVPYRKEMTQQHGYFHAGVAAAIADSACGYAAYGLMPVTSSVLTVE